MGWGYGFVNGRDVGYGVPSECDQPECKAEIDRGLSYICGGDIGGGEHGCGLFFCEPHLNHEFLEDEEETMSPQLCEPCAYNFVHEWPDAKEQFSPKPDVPEWLRWKLNDESWADWRAENPVEVERIKGVLSA